MADGLEIECSKAIIGTAGSHLSRRLIVEIDGFDWEEIAECIPGLHLWEALKHHEVVSNLSLDHVMEWIEGVSENDRISILEALGEW